MQSIPLDWLEEKARSFQVASQIAYQYAQEPHSKQWLESCQANQRIASASARRYLWAAIERRNGHAS
jgi:hypothetical protein